MVTHFPPVYQDILDMEIGERAQWVDKYVLKEMLNEEGEVDEQIIGEWMNRDDGQISDDWDFLCNTAFLSRNAPLPEQRKFYFDQHQRGIELRRRNNMCRDVVTILALIGMVVVSLWIINNDR